jgi:hypothetical protein
VAVTIQKRTTKRSRVLLVAAIAADGAVEDARIRDASSEGALVEMADPPPLGTNVMLYCGPTSVEARVAWVDGSWFGVEFAAPLTSGFLVDKLGSKLKVSAPRGYRHDRVPEADEEAAETSARVIRLRDSLR